MSSGVVDQLGWFLEGFVDESRQIRRVPIQHFPFRIGRKPGLDLTLGSSLVSQTHAEILDDEGALMLSDLGSTNGTFVNQQRLEGKTAIHEGDILHFAKLEFRLGMADLASLDLIGKTIVSAGVLPQLQVDRSRQLRELLEHGAVVPAFQPIIHLTEGTPLGYEVLGRSGHGGPSAAELFETATALGAEAELSRLFRSKCVEDCLRLPGTPLFFLNTHPAELGTRELADSLTELRRSAPELPITLEIHEAAITEPGTITELRAVLDELDMRLAYDDFGAGRARLRELADAPPDYLKFDIGLVRNIHKAPESRQTLLASLVRMVLELGVQPIAEGVEREAEAETCRELDFTFGQGFHFGQPVAAAEILDE